MVSITLISVQMSQGACVPGPPMNPVTDICWDCAFPLTIAGLTIIPG